jgi:hypothetical protein
MTVSKPTLLMLAVALAFGAENLSVFGRTWSVPYLEDWKILNENGTPFLHMVRGREPLPGPRRPFQFALLDMQPAARVNLQVDIRPLKRSCIIVYAYRDPAHFNYAHLSTDTGSRQPVHNGIFHVYGGERVRISSPNGPAAFPEINRWYHVTLAFDGAKGEVNVTVDGTPVPALHAIDLSLTDGRIGLGSFDETGDFKNFKIEAM